MTAGPRPTARPPSGLYVHVPFCVSICPYCDFVVLAGRAARGPASRIPAFLAALSAELELRADALDRRWGPPGERPGLSTLYFGGGTPSLLPASTIARLIELVRRRFGLLDDAEVTLEVNPGPDERGDAAAQRDAGVNRLSIGAQSFAAPELRTLGRRHRPEDVGDAVREARAAGLASISLDLLYDVPGQTIESWARSLDAAIDLGVDHVSAYGLTLDDPEAEGLTTLTGDHLPVREGARRWRRRAAAAQDEDRAAAMYELADARLSGAGLAWYEISNWARPGRESRHNLGYWLGGAWEAVGPGAHASDGSKRRWNAARLDAYVGALAPPDDTSPRLPPGGVAETSASRGELAMLSLRTSHGLPASGLDDPATAGALRWAVEAGLAAPVAGRVVLSMRGRLLSNEVFARLV